MIQTKTKLSAELVLAAKAGDTYAQSELYRQCYNTVYYAAKTIVKDEEAALDIVQDSFLRAFSHMDLLTNPDSFLPWMKRIAVNGAKNWLRKKKPLLFTDITTVNEKGEEEPPDFRDSDLTSQPEEVLDAKTKKELLWQIIDALSDEQRLVVSMYYFQEMSVAEIAQMLGVSQNTVKSRLNYARKKIEARVLDLEKRGTKLYGLAPLPFLLWLFLQNQKFNPAMAVPLASAAAGTAAHTGSAAAAGTTAHTTAATAAGTAAKGLGVKIAAGVAAVTLVGGVALGAASLTSGGSQAAPQSAVVSEAETQSSGELYSWYMEPSVEAQDINLMLQTTWTVQPDGTREFTHYEDTYHGAFYIKTDTGIGVITDEGQIITPTTFQRVSVQENQTVVLQDASGAQYAVSIPDGTLTPYVKPAAQQESEDTMRRSSIISRTARDPGAYLLVGESPTDTDGDYYRDEPEEDFGCVNQSLPAFLQGSYWGYMDLEGNVVLDPVYQPIWQVDSSVVDLSGIQLVRSKGGPPIVSVYLDQENPDNTTGTFHLDRAFNLTENCIVVQKAGEGVSLITRTGEEIIPAGAFYQLRPVSNGRLWAQQEAGGPWGILELSDEALQRIRNSTGSQN